MLHYLFDIIDNIVFGFTHNLSIAGLINTYWFLFFIEFPRYYLLELIITIYYKLTYKRRQRRQQEARMKLFLENPLVSILAPGKNEGEHIHKLVQSLREQTYQNYEIIIVDDGPTMPPP